MKIHVSGRKQCSEHTWMKYEEDFDHAGINFAIEGVLRIVQNSRSTYYNENVWTRVTEEPDDA